MGSATAKGSSLSPSSSSSARSISAKGSSLSPRSSSAVVGSATAKGSSSSPSSSRVKLGTRDISTFCEELSCEEIFFSEIESS